MLEVIISVICALVIYDIFKWICNALVNAYFNRVITDLLANSLSYVSYPYTNGPTNPSAPATPGKPKLSIVR